MSFSEIVRKGRYQDTTPTRNYALLPPSVREVVDADQGRALDSATRRVMERRTGHDLRKVRVHDGGRAAESARDVGAAAYTVGEHVVFGAGRHTLSREGEHLLAHELVHVIQQARAMSLSGLFSSDEHPSEREAETFASNPLVGSQTRIGMHSSVPLVQRQPSPWTFSPAPKSPSDVRLDWRTVERTLEESEAPIRRWLDENANDVKILSLDDAVRLVQRNVLEAAGMSSGNVAAAVSAWAADKGIVLPRVSAVASTPGATQPAPTAPKKSALGLSPYGMGMVGLHLELNPTSEPAIATMLRPYRDRGITVDDKTVRDVMSNYELGIQELENLLRSTGLVGGPDTVHKTAEWIAKRLLTQTITVSAQQQQPTAVEAFEAENRKMMQAVGVQPPSALKSVGFGASLTLHFDFLGGK